MTATSPASTRATMGSPLTGTIWNERAPCGGLPGPAAVTAVR